MSRSQRVVAEGPVGTRLAGRLRLFRYEIRRWRDGVIPDAGDAVSVVSVSTDLAEARQLLDLVPIVPTPVWGRDELAAGEMWNSNSVTAWLLACSGVNMKGVGPPDGGRAPGWRAGVVVAGRPSSGIAIGHTESTAVEGLSMESADRLYGGGRMSRTLAAWVDNTSKKRSMKRS